MPDTIVGWRDVAPECRPRNPQTGIGHVLPTKANASRAVWRPCVNDWLDVTRDGMTSGIEAPGYTIVNLNMRGDYAIDDRVKLFARVDNLFNLHYQNPTGFLAPGFGIFGSMQWPREAMT